MLPFFLVSIEFDFYTDQFICIKYNNNTCMSCFSTKYIYVQLLVGRYFWKLLQFRGPLILCSIWLLVTLQRHSINIHCVMCVCVCDYVVGCLTKNKVSRGKNASSILCVSYTLYEFMHKQKKKLWEIRVQINLFGRLR